MKSKKFGYLTESDPHILKMLRDDLEEGGECMWIMLHKIEGLLYGCFEFGINPLPKLRKVFPAYTWEYIDLTYKSSQGYRDSLARIARTSDFFWHAVDCGEGNHWVVAKKIGGITPAQVFGNRNPDGQSDNILEVFCTMPHGSVKMYKSVIDSRRVKLKNNRIMS